VKRLEARSLTLGYEKKTILANLDLEVREGELCVLIGPNGAGKSTLLSALAGFHEPFSGEVLLDGAGVLGFSSRGRARQIGSLFRFPENPLPLSLREFVSLGRYPHRLPFQAESASDREKVEQALEQCSIDHLSTRPITELSTGERQLAHTALLLAQETPVMVLDEPVSHLDIHHAVLILDILREKARQGNTLILSLHDLNQASLYADRCVALGGGTIFQQGTPGEVITEGNMERLYGPGVNLIISAEGYPLVYPGPGRGLMSEK
jgi:iron complex transport system ATP-binding protein